jgi:ribosomal-protein-alanine N-acetyltransferase
MITYRPATPFDLTVFASLDKELFPYGPWTTAQYKEEFTGTARYFVVALDQAQAIIGYAGVLAPGNGVEADVLTIGVVPAHRGKGIARQLMELITDWAKECGTNDMMLEVKTDNSAAIGLYESLGYLKLNVRKGFYGPGLDAQVMRLELP